MPRDLGTLRENLQSISLRAGGAHRYREGLYPADLHGAGGRVAVVDTIDAFADEVQKSGASGWPTL